MARIRTLKPEFFDDPDIGSCSFAARLLFAGLWTQADKAGRLDYNPRVLKARLFPYDEGLDVEALTGELEACGAVKTYQVSPAVEKHGEPWKGKTFLWVVNFQKHQRPHPKEPDSQIPAYSRDAVEKHGEPGKDTASQQTKGREGVLGREGKESPHTRAMPAGVQAGTTPRDHLKHVWCGQTFRVCVPEFLHGELVRRLGGEDADARIRAWYAECEAALDPEKPVPEAVKFWRAAFELQFVPTLEMDKRIPAWARASLAEQAKERP